MSESGPVAPQLKMPMPSARHWMSQTGEHATEMLSLVGEEVYNQILADMDEFAEYWRDRAARFEELAETAMNIKLPSPILVEQASVSPPKWSEMMAEQHTCPLCDRTFTNAMELYRDEERAIDLVAKAASGGSAGGGVSSIPSDYNRAYQFMHTWLLKRNPKYANHKLTVRMRRNRLAELLREYAAISHPVDAQGPESAPAQEIGENCYACGRTIRPTMGPGDYSCVSCGFGMVEPCEHWKASIAREEVGNSDNAASAGEPTEAGKPTEPNDWPKALPGESLEFTKFWESANNGPWFSVHPITQATLRQVASEAYQAGAHAPTTPEGEK